MRLSTPALTAAAVLAAAGIFTGAGLAVAAEAANHSASAQIDAGEINVTITSKGNPLVCGFKVYPTSVRGGVDLQADWINSTGGHDPDTVPYEHAVEIARAEAAQVFDGVGELIFAPNQSRTISHALPAPVDDVYTVITICESPQDNDTAKAVSFNTGEQAANPNDPSGSLDIGGLFDGLFS